MDFSSFFHLFDSMNLMEDGWKVLDASRSVWFVWLCIIK